MIDKFHDVIDIKFTAGMERQLDEVEQGNTNYVDILRKFYTGFSGELEKAEDVYKRQGSHWASPRNFPPLRCWCWWR